jgi:hypothetical protein
MMLVTFNVTHIPEIKYWISVIHKKNYGLSPRANYTDRATAACPRSDCQILRIEGATWSAWRIPTAVFSVFYTGAATFLSSSSSVVLTRLSGPRSRPTTVSFFFFRNTYWCKIYILLVQPLCLYVSVYWRYIAPITNMSLKSLQFYQNIIAYNINCQDITLCYNSITIPHCVASTFHGVTLYSIRSLNITLYCIAYHPVQHQLSRYHTLQHQISEYHTTLHQPCHDITLFSVDW